MKKEKEEMLGKLRNVRQTAECYLESNNFENYVVKEVIHYSKKVRLVNRETRQEEEFDLYAVIAEKDSQEIDEDTTFELEYLGDKDGNIFTISDLIKEYEGFESIKDVVDKTKENEEHPGEEQAEELKTEKLTELEEEKEKEQSEKGLEKKKDEESSKAEDLKISNLKGEIDLDQQVNGETLRKILGLSEDYVSIAPVRASTVGAEGSAEYCFVAIKNDRTCTVLGEDTLVEDRQEGVNPYDKDLKVNNDGSLSKESSISGFKIVNRSNLYLSVRFDESSSTRETTISDRSGREGQQEVEHELHKSGDGVIDSDARAERMAEDGISGADRAVERQEEHQAVGCENDRVENIDGNSNNDTHEHNEILLDEKIEGTNMTWRQFANECGFRGEGAIEKAAEKFKEYKEANPELSNQELVEGAIEQETEDFRAPDLERKK